jgi:tetraacyldisaccharide 4'-kinase
VTVGGSGKTPVALWLAARLAEQGHRPAILARGYGREGGTLGVRLALTEGAALRNAAHLGDELALAHARGFIAVSCPDRREGLRWAQNAGATIAVLDDGLQQRRLLPNARVLVVDGRWPTGGGFLPAGQARERLKDVLAPDVLWCQHQPLSERLSAELAGHRVLGQTRPSAWIVDGRDEALTWRPSLPVMVVTGIAHPGSVYRLLRGLGVHWEDALVFPDHHRFTVHDVAALRAASERYRLVTTEKDAVRLPSDLALAVLRVDVDPGESDDWLRRWLAERWPVD